MARSRASAKAAGSRAERLVADYLADRLDDIRIDRKVKTGAQDKGDVANVRSAHDERIVVEVKDTIRTLLGEWMNEVDAEKINDGAPVGVIVHKRKNYGEKKVGGWYVTCTLDDLIRLIQGPGNGTE